MYSSSFVGLICGPLWLIRKHSTWSGLESNLLSELCKWAKVWKLHTSLYYPQTDGQYEHFNRILINLLGTLPLNKKTSWRGMVVMLVHVYNCTRSTATGFSPYYLMYGQKPWLPVDLYLVPKRQTCMPLQVLNLCNNCVEEWSRHAKLPNIS